MLHPKKQSILDGSVERHDPGLPNTVVFPFLFPAQVSVFHISILLFMSSLVMIRAGRLERVLTVI